MMNRDNHEQYPLTTGYNSEGELRYYCDFPGCESTKAYKGKSGVYGHIRRKHTNSRYDCDQCEKWFNDTSVLNKHKKEYVSSF